MHRNNIYQVLAVPRVISVVKLGLGRCCEVAVREIL